MSDNDSALYARLKSIALEWAGTGWRGGDPTLSSSGLALLRVLEGEDFAKEGEHAEVAYELITNLMERHISINSGVYPNLFRRSLHRARGLTLKDIEYMVLERQRISRGDDIPDPYCGMPGMPKRKYKLPWRSLKSLSERWAHGGPGTQRYLGEALSRVLYGEVIAAPGAPPDEQFFVSSDLIQALVGTNLGIAPDDYRKLFEDSVNAWEQYPFRRDAKALTLDDVEVMAKQAMAAVSE